jgi:hypothetical protein
MGTHRLRSVLHQQHRNPPQLEVRKVSQRQRAGDTLHSGGTVNEQFTWQHLLSVLISGIAIGLSGSPLCVNRARSKAPTYMPVSLLSRPGMVLGVRWRRLCRIPSRRLTDEKGHTDTGDLSSPVLFCTAAATVTLDLHRCGLLDGRTLPHHVASAALPAAGRTAEAAVTRDEVAGSHGRM